MNGIVSPVTWRLTGTSTRLSSGSLLSTPLADEIPALLAASLPRMLAQLEESYGTGNTAVATDDGAITDADRAWGLAPPRDYAEILARTIERDYRPRFAARDITLPR